MDGKAQARLRRKTALFTIIVVLCNVLGNAALAHGMHSVGEPSSPFDHIRALFHPWVATGVALLILWMLSHMALLSWADLSYVLPVTAIGYVLTAVAGKVLFGEVVTVSRWAGIALIVGGVLLVSRTAVRTTDGKL